MSNELIEHKSWVMRNWKWLIPTVALMSFSIVVFFSSGLDGITADLTRAYTDEELYENAFEKVKSHDRVVEILGKIKPIDKFAILEGSVKYSSDNQIVNSSVRVKGVRGKGMMDITANRIGTKWEYEKINFRIEKPFEDKQTIEIVKTKN